jgi:hypothetical protein
MKTKKRVRIKYRVPENTKKIPMRVTGVWGSNISGYHGYFLWGKGGRCLGLTILPPLCVNCLEILGASCPVVRLKDPVVDGRIILKWIFEKWVGGMDWIDLA